MLISEKVLNLYLGFYSGHSRLYKITSLDREEMKKREKEERKKRAEEEEGRPLIWIKYTLGLKHQVCWLYNCMLLHLSMDSG